MKKVVFFTGAGISAESGIQTFRDADGLWEQYNVEDVATKDGWRRDQALVLEFYNKRHAELNSVKPNLAHEIIAELELDPNLEVTVITQNVDNLHEVAGTKNIIHLHGELMKKRSSMNPKAIFDWPLEEDINPGDRAPDNSQMRPHIVWFGEDVPEYPKAQKIIENANILVVVGSSLQVYPAANLVNYLPYPEGKIYVIDPGQVNVIDSNVYHIKKTATKGMKEIKKILSK